MALHSAELIFVFSSALLNLNGECCIIETSSDMT